MSSFIKNNANAIAALAAASALAVSIASAVIVAKQQQKVEQLENLLDVANLTLSKIQPWATSMSSLEQAVQQIAPQNKPAAEMPSAMPKPKPAVDMKGERRYGSASARFTIKEYSDLECPYCKDYYPVPKALVDSSKGNISLVFKHVPVHGEASRREALAAECAAEQGGNDAFYRMVGEIFSITEGNGTGTAKSMSAIANQIGLDGAQLASCIDNETYLDKVREDFTEAVEAGIKQTPTLLIFDNQTGSKFKLEGVHTPQEIMKAIARLVNPAQAPAAQEGGLQ